ncbi:MAG: hypothetical protein F7C32_03070 [Desulfurococcales archaeon]|nr:hypothetical protein [Desulfurococcales archaeon]
MAGNSVFLVASPTAYIPTRFHLRGYAGHTGRMDVLIRSIISCAGGSYSYYGLLCGKEKGTGLCPAIIVEDCSRVPVKVEEHDIVKGILDGSLAWARLETIDVEHLVWRLSKEKFSFIMLDEHGTRICDKHPGNPLVKKQGLVFFLGGHTGFPESLHRVISRYKPSKISVGPISLHTSNVVIVVRYIFEIGLRGFCEDFESLIKGGSNGYTEQRGVD